MKTKILYFALFALLLLNSTGCKESFLETLPKDQLTTETFYKSEDDFIQSINGVYGINNIWRQKMEFFPMVDIATPVATRGSGRFGQFDWGGNGYTPDGVPGDVRAWFSYWWIGIARANEVLYRLEEAEDGIFTTAGLKDQIKGEALFLRAIYYFYLSDIWGGMPLITEPVTTETYYPERDTKTAITEQMISDLKEAQNLLPSITKYRNSPAEMGRASKEAAQSLLGKIYCAEEQWENASTELKKVIDSNNFELTPGATGFIDQFWPEGENGIESIFEWQYMSGIGDQYGNSFVSYCATGAAGLDVGGNGWNYIEPTDYLVDLYETKNGYKVTSTWTGSGESQDYFTFSSDDPEFDPEDAFAHRDPRLKWTVAYEGNPYVDEKWPENTFTAASPMESNYGNLKMIVYEEGFAQSDMNMVVLRFADVLLLYAEAQMELNNLDEATKYVNRVRSRPSVSMPDVPAGIAGSQSDLRQYIREERIRELATEYGHVFYDMRRWGIYVDEMENYWTANKFGRENPAVQIDEHNVLWPIPTQELDLNPNMVQNPGY
ncbi:RagB/SusD family nutrient uptake outer membrane protein [Maribellus maritimus]|uniref:RagB/SusD family nutrient uptake outer membrane protein n=1 Tax=Maribellus maritimus TaxID=2870838 RepID=UPI001EEC71AD|nr:RagB/SusD family nutrient uptake outer membrane protein [Maribellus maritimus]MCG6186188.1 RagB/SusD family nutrient uptake outer membrane protein [Maribellus maritimus]